MSFGPFFFSSESCFFSFFLSKDALETDNFFLDYRREHQQGNEVWNCHECIGNIGKSQVQICV